MENNEISMFMEVKCDLNDRKAEVLLLRNWTKCLVKIEAIKCFPCYFRITFIRNVEDESANLCVRINIPGLSVRLAVSRTKTHSYGLFWKQNRKRCCIFLAFDSESSCVRHMKWMKKSIRNLELHRQELLQAKRNSVDKSGEGSQPVLEAATNIMDETKGVRDLRDILGPLPKIPDARESGNWSRRVSGVSGIYEEIPDGDCFPRRTSRASVASGIYEEMKPPNSISAKRSATLKPVPPPPPPLPRKRINTCEIDQKSIPRSLTNPETEMAKKKKYLMVLESVFGRSKRSVSVSEGKVSQLADFDVPLQKPSATNTPELPVYVNSNVIARQKNTQPSLCRYKAKRNSFSTPDLTNPCLFDNFESSDDVSLESFDSNVFLSDDQALSNECIPFHACNPSPESFVFDLNVSDQIQPNFNISCNMSTVNLVGSNLNIVQATSTAVVDDLSGYCVMAPIKKDRKKSSDSDKENEKNSKETCDDQIYENMDLKLKASTSNKETKERSHIYQNFQMNSPKSTDVLMRPKDSSQSDNDLNKSRRLSTNIDDKVPSYFPNDCDLIKTHRRKSNSVSDKIGIRQLDSLKTNHRENLYISSPQKILDQRKKSTSHDHHKPMKLRALKTSSTMYSVVKSGQNKPHSIDDPDEVKQINAESQMNSDRDQEMNSKNNERSPRIYQKYATLTRISPNKYLEKCAKKSNDIGTVRKFASLPRFRKIDFSPLKMKINSVLQRHHSEGL